MLHLLVCKLLNVNWPFLPTDHESAGTGVKSVAVGIDGCSQTTTVVIQDAFASLRIVGYLSLNYYLFGITPSRCKAFFLTLSFGLGATVFKLS